MSKIEIALIPPGSLQHWNTNRKFEMIIPDGIRSASTYSSYYAKLSAIGNEHKYVMMDNGAFEARPVAPVRLLEMAHTYRIDELAAPDVMGDLYMSINYLEGFLILMDAMQSRAYLYDKLKVMAIVQGQNLEECKLMVGYIANTTRAGVTWTLGLPKHLVATTGQRDVRLKLVRFIQREYEHIFQIHALGYNYPGEVQGLAGLGVRSMDTSAPFVATYLGIPITDLTSSPRPPDYWSLPSELFDSSRLESNIRYLDEWAKYGHSE